MGHRLIPINKLTSEILSEPTERYEIGESVLYQRAHEIILFWDAKLFHSGSNSGTPWHLKKGLSHALDGITRESDSILCSGQFGKRSISQSVIGFLHQALDLTTMRRTLLRDIKHIHIDATTQVIR